MLQLFENDDTSPLICCFFHYLNYSIYIGNLQSSTIFKQGYHEVSCNQNFCMKYITTPNPKNVIATRSIVTIEISKLTFLIMLYFYGHIQDFLYRVFHIQGVLQEKLSNFEGQSTFSLNKNLQIYTTIKLFFPLVIFWGKIIEVQLHQGNFSKNLI